MSVLDRWLIRRFHHLYYASGSRTWGNGSVRWLGHETQKCPLDMWVYQELLHATRPELVIETGTHRGGSALFFAGVLEQLRGPGRVITIDIITQPDRPSHDRIEYVAGSSTDPGLAAHVTAAAAGRRTMVVLDSDHAADHVAAELDLYAPAVSVGCYLVVEDTNVGGHPVVPRFGPGPYEAVRDFLRADSRFVVDRDCERFLLTFNPGGYLRRVA